MTGNVREIDITTEMHAAYLDYAMSVIVARALPDVRDGLKPVHRRILYAMHDMGVTSNRPYKKSARIVGEVLGKYHPHNDTSVYDAMVRMAQEFSLRYPLVDGQGNFGSIDGDNAAAMRYTEARLAAISDLMLTDIEKETVDWRDNFDTTLKEPAILPAALPNLLINGANGIAVGMATNIPPHNLAEVVDATVHLIDNFDRIEDVGVSDLLQFIKGPDFPTGGILFRYRQGKKGEEETDAVSQAYANGRGRLILQAKAHFEEMSRSRSRIVVTNLPYQTNKTNLLERIATLVRDGKIGGITDLRDESDRSGMRIVIELTRSVEPKAVFGRLLRLTPMRQTVGVSLLALAGGEPRTLNLKRILTLFIEHRREIIRRRSEYDLARAKERSHIVEGLLKALDMLDEVIQTIRRSRRVDTARNNLQQNFGFTQVQAQAILDMPLRRLTALERRQLQDEHRELLRRIAYLEGLLADEAKVLGVAREELLAQRQEHADRRRTQIVERAQGALTATDLLPDRTVWVALGARGELRRRDFDGINRAELRRCGQNAAGALFTANTRDRLFLFAADGRCRHLGVHELPQDSSKHVADLTDFSRRDAVTAMLALPQDPPDGFLFLVSRLGSVKRIALADFVQAAVTEPKAMSLPAKDRLACAFWTRGGGEVVLITRQGRSIRFPEESVRAMGAGTRGVAGVNLRRGDEVAAALPVAPGSELLTATAAGFVKRTPIDDFAVQGRGGGGIIAHRLNDRTGELAGAVLLGPEQEFAALVTGRGVAKPLEIDRIPSSGRATLGSRQVDLASSDSVAAVQAASPQVPAIDCPSLPPADRLNGGAEAMAARPPSAGPSAPAEAGSSGSGSGKRSGKPAAKRRGRANGAAAKGAAVKSQPQRPAERRLDSDTARERPAAAGKDASAAAKVKAGGAKAEKGTRPRRNAGKEGRQKAADGAASGRRQSGKAAARTTPATERDRASRAPEISSAGSSAKRGKAGGDGGGEGAGPADQQVQGSLLGELIDAKPASGKGAKNKGKLRRVSSVVRGQKRTKG